jgi:hypothetical protein
MRVKAKFILATDGEWFEAETPEVVVNTPVSEKALPLGAARDGDLTGTLSE